MAAQPTRGTRNTLDENYRTWNNSWPIGRVEFKDYPTIRQILKAMRDKGVLTSGGKLRVDNDGCVQNRNTGN